MNDTESSVDFLKGAVKDFVHARNWEKFHNPKDIAESICIEAAELLEIFQWIKSENSEQFNNDPKKMQKIREEIADVAIYCLSLANRLDIDLTTAVLSKLDQNNKKYPIDLYRGKANL